MSDAKDVQQPEPSTLEVTEPPRIAPRVITPDGADVTAAEAGPASGGSEGGGPAGAEHAVGSGAAGAADTAGAAGAAVGSDAAEAEVDDAEPEADDDGVSSIEEPAKVMRIGAMIKRLLDEVRDAPLDDAARTRLAEIHERSLKELEDGLSPDLVEELHRITLPFADDGTPPSDAELRIAQAQLVGWLEGLFHGIQTALVAQQMAAQAQLTQMRRGLPPGAFPGGASGAGPIGGQGGPQHGGPEDGRPSPGQYL